MKLALMQPYFFPYLGYFELIHRADRFVYFDTVQFKKGGWINRNRVMNGAGSWSYLTVPLLKHPLSTTICDIRISEARNWRADMLNKLAFYRREAPYFFNVVDLFEESVFGTPGPLSELNIRAIGIVCRYLGLSISHDTFSSLKLDAEPVEKAKDWALNISKALGAKEYINLPGGASLYSAEDFRNAGIRLTFLDSPDLLYSCGSNTQIPDLSILDVMMWVSPEKIRNYLMHRNPNFSATLGFRGEN